MKQIPQIANKNSQNQEYIGITIKLQNRFYFLDSISKLGKN